MRSRIPLTIFIIAVVGIGLLIGWLTAPGEWYAGLQKPWFNPPNWLFGPVWTILYVMVAVAGWRIWSDDLGSLKGLWLTQMALNFLWSPVFFGAQSVTLALIVIVALLAAIALFIWKTWPVDRTVAVLFLPYAAWVAFATALNLAILLLN
ncbi:TspO/MBR family protein [Mesorhizobium sp. ZC-5]|uniref:TspO/MBR family protein n=1 Tax=Mesorhizobium sp. ZC-5 TaxID=2986066 RepID=UPI0021E82AFA|nr:TspO/MBR family protein [Mesorhizobium sp. ZC-5]MCV3243543.1 tryptophan-rich sensory protein [Mesorhizobium sp. ZC-5]